MPLNAATEAARLSTAPMEDRTDFLAELGLHSPEACNLCALQSEGPESAQKQPLAETQQVHTLSG